MIKSKYCGITGDELANMLCKPSKYSKKEAEEIIEKAEERIKYGKKEPLK